jgi:hypothetical protein
MEVTMIRTRKDTVATALVAIAVLIYIGDLTLGSVPLVQDVKGMAAVGLVLSFVSRRIGGRHGFRHERVAMVANFGSLALGFAALATGSSALLALFMASVVALWVAAAYARTDGFHTTHLHAAH